MMHARLFGRRACAGPDRESDVVPSGADCTGRVVFSRRHPRYVQEERPWPYNTGGRHGHLTLRASPRCSRIRYQLSELRKIETSRHELSADQKAGCASETKLRGFASGARENASDFPGVRLAVAAQLSHVDACGPQGRINVSSIRDGVWRADQCVVGLQVSVLPIRR